MTPRTGEIWLADLDPVVANEQAGTRPCLVVSTDAYNAMPIRHAIIAPITTRDRALRHHVPVVDDGGLHMASFAMPEYQRSLSTRRFIRRIGTADPATVATVRERIRRFVGL